MDFDKETWKIIKLAYEKKSIKGSDFNNAELNISNSLAQKGILSLSICTSNIPNTYVITAHGRAIWETHLRDIKKEKENSNFMNLQTEEIKDAIKYYKEDVQLSNEANKLSKKANKKSTISNLIAFGGFLFGIAGFIVALIALISDLKP